MKKESTGKKSLLWLWITIGIVVLLAIAGVVAYFVFFGNNGGTGSEQNGPTGEKKVESDLYWNIDRKDMLEVTSGLSMREPAEDGIYYIRFAVGGEVVELPCADKKLVNRIDMEDLVCLEFDADGVIINMVDPEEVYTKIAEKVYVQNISGNKLLVNTSQALNGMQINLEVPATEGFDVSALAGTPGERRVLEGMDQVTIYGTDEETPTHIFVVDRWWESDVYWRVSAPKTSGGHTTRKQAEDGYWYMDWTVKGETVTLRTNRNDVIDVWEGYSITNACCGMVFNEDGTEVIDCFSAAWAVRGTHKAAQWDVVELSEDKKTFTIERILFGNDVGKTFTGTIGEDCGVYNVTTTAEVLGEVTELQLNDRLQVYCDAMGNPKVIYVMNRMVDSPLYYNLNRNWSDGLGKSQRTPDADGWYNFELLVNGKIVTYRTKDAVLANKVDSYSMSLFGLKVQNGVILKVYDAICVTGNYSWVSGYYVSDIQGTVITAISGSTSKSGVMTSDCQVYDVSGHSTPKGKVVELRIGDRFTAYQNALGEVTHVYITDRYQAGTAIYYNMARKALKNGETAREKNEEGFYVFDVIKLGSTTVTQIKTQDPKVAAAIDKQGNPYLFAGRVNKDGVITAAYAPQAAIEGGARRVLPGVHVERQISEDENTWHCVVRSTGATGTLKVTENTKIYNISKVYDKARGELTTLRVEDQLYAYQNSAGETVLVVLVSREAPGSKVFHKYKVDATPDEEGYYHMILATGGKVGEYKTKDKTVRDYIAGQTLAVAAFEKNGIITSAFAFSCHPDYSNGSAGSYYDVVKVVGNKVYVKRNRPGQTDTGKEAVIELASNAKIYNISTNKTLEEGWGLADKLQPGDRVQGYVDKDGKCTLLTIVLENLRSDDGYAVCPHCGENVWWERLDSNSGAIAADGHYYVAKDFSTNSGYSFGKAPAEGEEDDYHFVLDMNGKTITRIGTLSTRKDKEGKPILDEVTGEPVQFLAGSTGIFYVNYGHMILDDFSAGKTGKIVSDPNGVEFSGSYTAFGCGANAEMTIKNITVDYTTAKSSYTSANGGVIALGGKLTIEGGTFIGMGEHKGSGSIIGTWSGSELIIKGGTFVGGKAKNGGLFATNGNVTITGGDFSGGSATNGGILYAGGAANTITIKGGKFHDAKSTSSGGFIYAAGNTYITGGEFVGVGADKDMESRSGGIIYAQGMELFIDNITLKDGSGSGYGNNIYYRNDNGGVFTIGANATIYGNTTVRSVRYAMYKTTEENVFTKDSKAANVVKDPDGKPVVDHYEANPVLLVIMDGAVIDSTGSNPNDNNNLRVQNVAFFANNADGQPLYHMELLDASDACKNYSVKVDCQGKILAVVEGTSFEVVHEFGDDRVCDDCGYDLDAFVEWTDSKNLPTKAGNYKLMVDVEITSEYGGVSATIDLNGHNITRIANSKSGGVWGTGSGNSLTIIDTSAGTPGTVKTVYAEGLTHTSSGGVVFTVNEKSTLHIKAGIIDGSAVDVTYKTTNTGTIVSGGTLIIEGERTVVKGVKSAAGNGGAIGGWSNDGSTITIKDGAKVYGSQATAGSGAVLATTGEGVTIENAYIYEGIAGGSGNGIWISASKTVLTVKDATIDGGFQITGCKSATFTGAVKIGKGAEYGLITAKPVDMTGLTAGASVNISGSEATITTDFADAAAAQKVLDDGLLVTTQQYTELQVSGSAIKIANVIPDDVYFDWTEGDSLPAYGNYRLTKDVVLTAAHSVNGTLRLDLNGYSISRHLGAGVKGGYVIEVAGTSKLYVTDTSSGTPGKISMTHEAETLTSLSAVVYPSQAGTFVLDNGIIDGSGVTSTYKTAKTGAVTVGNGKLNGQNVYGTFIMNGGMILGQQNTTDNAASAIGGMGSTSIIINGGVIKASEAEGYTHVNGALINTAGTVKVTGGEFYGATVSGNGGIMVASQAVEISGGHFIGGSAKNGGQIYASSTLTVTGGKFEGFAARRNDQGAGGSIYGAGKTYILGGEFIAPETESFSGGIIYSHGMELKVDNVTLKNGRGYGWGMNIYYYNDNSGVITIGKNAVIGGGLTIRATKNAVKVVVEDGAQVDCTGTLPNPGNNIRVQNVDFYINEATGTPAQTYRHASDCANYSLQYNCKGELVNIVAGTTNAKVHVFGDDTVCDGCGYDKAAYLDWTDATSLPTAGNYKLAVDVTVNQLYSLTGELNLDLNGHNITRTVAVDQTKNQAIYATGAYALTIDDTSANAGTVTATYAEGASLSAADGALFTVSDNANSVLTLKNGIYDGSNITSTYTATNNGLITGGGKVVVEGKAVLKGLKNNGDGSVFGMWSNSHVIVNGGTIYGGSAKNGGILASNGDVTINGGTFYAGTVTEKGSSFYISSGNTTLTVNGGKFDGGFEIVNCKSATFAGDVQINKTAGYGLKTAKAIDMTGLTENAIIFVNGTEGVITTDFADAATAQKVLDDTKLITNEQDLELKVVGTAIQLVAKSSGSEPGTGNEPGTGTEPDDSTEKIVWTDWTEETSLPTSGNIRLTKDVTLSSYLNIGGVEGTTPKAGTLRIDLNGHNITRHIPATATADQYVFYSSETDDLLYITDLSGNDQLGKVSMTHDAGMTFKTTTCVVFVSGDSTFILDNGIIDGSGVNSTFVGAKTGAVTVGNDVEPAAGKFIMNGGMILGQYNNNGSSGNAGSAIGGMNRTEIVINGGIVKAAEPKSANEAVVKAGGAICAQGSVTINGGEIIGSRAANHGGTIWVEDTNGKLVMTGGSVHGGYAGTNGGNIIVFTGASANITGGRIYGGKVGSASGSGYNIDISTGASAATSYIGGDVVIEGGLGIRSGKVVIKDRAIINGMLDAAKGYDIRLATAGTAVYYGEAETAYTATAAAELVSLDYNRAGLGVVTGIVATAALQDWTDATSLPTAGRYTLQTNVTVDKLYTVTGDLYIDLNGYSITRVVKAGVTSNQYIYHAVTPASGNGHSITLVDHKAYAAGEEKAKITATYEVATETNKSYAGLLYVNEGAGLNLKNVVLDVSHIDSTASANNGAILVGNYSKLYVNNATIKGFKSNTAGGGAIATWTKNVIVIDGDETLIEAGGATNNGGIIQTNGSLFEINGGTFRKYDNSNVTKNGGLFYVTNAGVPTSVVINGGTFYGADVTAGGGILCADLNNTDEVIINGGKFYAGKACNGGVLWTDAKLTVNGGEFYGVNTGYKTPVTNAQSHGGIMTVTAPEVTINGGFFTDGMPSGYGPNIYYKGTGTLTIGKDAVIAGGLTVRGTADKNAKVVVADGAVIDITKTVSTNKPGYNLRVNYAELWIEGKDAAEQTWVGANSDDQKNFNLVYTEGALTGIVTE